MGEVVGYARVSTKDQDLTVQLERLKAAGCTKIFSEKATGVDRRRLELERCLTYLRDGDALVAVRMDRLARSTAHLHEIAEGLKAKGVTLRFTDQPELDTSTATGRLLFGVIASVAQFERELLKERQIAGIAQARLDGVRFGQKPKLTPEIVHAVIAKRDEGLKVPELMRMFGLGKTSVYAALTLAEAKVGAG